MQTYDELNNLKKSKINVLPIEQYFREMDLTEEQKESRIEMAKKLKDRFIFIIALIETMAKYNSFDREYVRGLFVNSVKELLVDFDVNIVAIENYLNTSAGRIIDTTFNHIDNEWYVSSERSIVLAEEEANSIWNYSDNYDAMLLGKKKKQWITMRDNRVRHTHKEVDNTVVPISKPFTVGTSLMMFPRDLSLDADMEEVANCRCTIKYI